MILLKLLHLAAFAPCLQAKPIWDSCFSSLFFVFLALLNCVVTCILEHLALYFGGKKGREALSAVREVTWDNLYSQEVTDNRHFLGGTKIPSLWC